jgi:hypothetical protein
MIDVRILRLSGPDGDDELQRADGDRRKKKAGQKQQGGPGQR